MYARILRKWSLKTTNTISTTTTTTRAATTTRTTTTIATIAKSTATIASSGTNTKSARTAASTAKRLNRSAKHMSLMWLWLFAVVNMLLLLTQSTTATAISQPLQIMQQQSPQQQYFSSSSSKRILKPPQQPQPPPPSAAAAVAAADVVANINNSNSTHSKTLLKSLFLTKQPYNVAHGTVWATAVPPPRTVASIVAHTNAGDVGENNTSILLVKTTNNNTHKHKIVASNITTTSRLKHNLSSRSHSNGSNYSSSNSFSEFSTSSNSNNNNNTNNKQLPSSPLMSMSPPQTPLATAAATASERTATFNDSLVYSYYYRKASQQAAAAATVFATQKQTHPPHPQQQQQPRGSSTNQYTERDFYIKVSEDEAADDSENDSAAYDDENINAEYENNDEEEEASSAVTAQAFSNKINDNKIKSGDRKSAITKVPNINNSQIFNLFNTNNKLNDKNTQQQEKMLQQQKTITTPTTAQHSSKARRHVLMPPAAVFSKAVPQMQHTEMREISGDITPPQRTAPVPSQHVAKVLPTSNATFGPPIKIHYLIKAFEIPAMLPFNGMLSKQEQERQLRAFQHQQQTARNRRDSHLFAQQQLQQQQQQHYYNNAPLQRLTPQQKQQQQRLSNGFFQQQQQQQFAGINSNRQLQLQQSAKLHLTKQQQHAAHHPHQQHAHQHNQHNNNKQQQLQQHHHQQQQQRRRYCSARDPAQLAFEAPTVLEGKIISMTPDRRTNFSATFEVKEIFKQQISHILQKYLRLQFAYRNQSGECDIYREQLRPRGLVRGDELEPGRIYLLFLQQIGSSNFTILGQPIRKTRRVVNAVKNAVSDNYAQSASIRSISASNRTVEHGKELRIVCKVRGRPPPKVTWFKDHKSINRNRKLYQFHHYKKRSELIIRSFNSSDAGHYECRAKNKVNHNLERRAIVIKAYPVPTYETHSAGNKCPDNAAEFCFNGGTCKFFSEIGSFSCICPEGFIGERCDRKEVNNMPPSTYSNEQECGERKYLGSYYC